MSVRKSPLRLGVFDPGDSQLTGVWYELKQVLNLAAILVEVVQIDGIHWQEVDCFLLVPQEDMNSFHHTLDGLHKVYGDKEALLLSFPGNYPLLVNALRAGIKDVIHYPLMSEEVIEVLQRTLSHEDHLQMQREFLEINLKFHQFKERYWGQMAMTDDVTGLRNQRCLRKDMDELLGQGVFSILFIDIDHFKLVNDGNGHLIGSSILCEMGKRLRKMVRETDMIYRYGGDEFVILLPQTPKKQGFKVGQRILKRIKQGSFPTKRGEMPIFLSVSIGIAEFPTDAQNVDSILQIADGLLYKAKSEGRGQVQFLQEPPLPRLRKL